ncbi:winged helix-turn-helix domain-containing protein [Muricoccus nepalensis]|nr:winged helix-turn-helix domain-containing protein [Roseomonas nepalensis]
MGRQTYDPFVVYDVDGKRAGQTAAYLTECGLPAEAYSQVDEALERLAHAPLSLVLINWAGAVPQQALQILQSVRYVSNVPCVLRAVESNDDAHRVTGFNAGADDCIPGDFTDQEVIARIRAVVRRARFTVPAPTLTQPSFPSTMAKTNCSPWRLAIDQRDLIAPCGTPCGLSTAEFDFLYYLNRRRGLPVPRTVLSEEIFRRPWYPEDRAIDNVAARLRRRLAPFCNDPNMIKAVRGVGYVFTGIRQQDIINKQSTL